jgi:hypothetical protein
MKISIYAPYAEERFETARQQPILHPERIVGNSEQSRNGFEEVGRISTGESPSLQRLILTAGAFGGTYPAELPTTGLERQALLPVCT